MKMEKAQVYVFSLATGVAPLKDRGEYGFILNPEFDCETQLADIQYNDKHKTIGFECLVPTVNRIFYDYGIPAASRAKLSIQPTKNNDKEYYIICPPC
jgi:hypothetical protein